MAGGRAARRAQRRAAGETAGAPAAAAPAETLLRDGQRKVVLVLLLSGLAFAAVGLMVPPRGAAYWVAFLVAPALAGLAGHVLARGAGRRLDAWLLTGGQPKETPRALPPAELPAPALLALRTAILPALLADLARAAERMPPRCAAAARALVEAGATAPAGEARDSLARDLPRLFAGLLDGREEAAAEAEGLVLRLSEPRGGTG